MADVVYLRSYDDRTACRRGNRAQRARCDGRTAAGGAVRRASPCGRSPSARAFASARSCAHFRSKDAIVAEIYLDRLRAAPLIVDVELGAQERIAAQFSQLVMLLADEPGLAAACSSALMSDDPSVRPIRQRIHAEFHRRVRTVLRSGAWPEVAETLEFGLVGALVHASCGVDTFRQTADELAERGGRGAAGRRLVRRVVFGDSH